MIKGAIFDVDGTLLDSMQMWIHFGEFYLSSKGIEVGPDFDEKIKYFSLREVAEEISDNYPLGMTADEVEEDCERVTQNFYFEEVALKKGVRELLETLHNCGVQMYIATATYESLIRPALERLGIMKYFKGIVTCSDVGCGKDKPDVFAYALEQIKTPLSDTWVFEDALHAVKTAKAYGFKVFGVYDLTEDENKEKIKSICDVYRDSLEGVSIADIKVKNQ